MSMRVQRLLIIISMLLTSLFAGYFCDQAVIVRVVDGDESAFGGADEFPSYEETGFDGLDGRRDGWCYGCQVRYSFESTHAPQ